MLAGLPELPAAHRKRLQAEWGLTDFAMQSMVNAGALGVVEASVDAGASESAARKWWMGDLARAANLRGVELAELPMTPADVARLDALVTAGTLNDTLARQVVEGVLAGEGRPDDVVAARGLVIVSDEAALTRDCMAKSVSPHSACRRLRCAAGSSGRPLSLIHI